MNKKHVSWVSLTLPNFMEGLNVEIVEQTNSCIVDRYRAKRKVVCKLQHGRTPII